MLNIFITVLVTAYIVGMVFTGILGAMGFKRDEEIQSYSKADKIGIAIIIMGIAAVWFITLPYVWMCKKKDNI